MMTIRQATRDDLPPVRAIVREVVMEMSAEGNTQLEAFICRLAQERGIEHIKVDTYSTNAGMQAFLIKKGYRKVGEMEFLGKERPFFCYEKSTAAFSTPL